MTIDEVKERLRGLIQIAKRDARNAVNLSDRYPYMKHVVVLEDLIEELEADDDET